MNLLETIHTAVMALRAHKLRSCLTALGIIIGTSATIATLAIGAGARAQVAAQVQSLGSNLLIIVSGNVNQSGVRLGAGATPTLTDEDTATIGQEISSVQVTSSLISGKIQVVAEAANWATNVATVDPGYFEVRDWAVESGRAFEADEAKNGAQVALLGQTVAKQLFPDVDPIGHEVRIKNVPFKVIGMLAKKGQSTAGQDQDDALIVPLNAGRRVLGSNQAKLRSVAAILVKVRDGESMAQASEDVEGLLAPATSITAASGQRLHNTGSVGGYLRQRSRRQNTVHPPCIGRTCFAPNRRHWHPEHHARIGHGANQRNWRPNGCRSPAARHSSAILVRGRRVVGSWRRCGSDIRFGCRFRFCLCGGLVADRRLLGSRFGGAVFDAGRYIIWLVPGTASFPACADRGDQDRLKAVSVFFD